MISRISGWRCNVCSYFLAGGLSGFVVFFLFGCGGKGASDEADVVKGPATVEQAAGVIDLSTFALMENAKPPASRGVASVVYEAPGNAKAVYELARKKLISSGWKELPNTSVAAESASGTFSRKGFVVSVSVYPHEGPNNCMLMLQNHGNVRPAKLPVPPDTKPVYVGDLSAMYVTTAAVGPTAEACRKLLLADGWVPFGGAGDSAYYKKNAIRAQATVSVAPAQGGKTMISYSSELLSADLPAPADVDDLRYIEQNHELTFDTAKDQKAIVDFYKTSLGKAGWQPTLEHTVEISGRQEMIFRNPAKDMITLAMPPARDGRKLSVSVQHQSAAEIAELDRQLKEHEPEIRARIAAQRAAEDKQQAEENKPPPPLPKFAISLPPEATGVEQTKGEIKFTVGHGKAKAIVENWRKEFGGAGWKEDAAGLDAMAGAISFAKGNQSLTVNYTDTGVMPTEITVSGTGVEVEAQVQR